MFGSPSITRKTLMPPIPSSFFEHDVGVLLLKTPGSRLSLDETIRSGQQSGKRVA